MNRVNLQSSRAVFITHMLVLVVLWVLFFWRILIAAAPDRQVFPVGDFTQHYYAFSQYQAERLQDGEFLLWNPYNHSGDTFAGNIQFVAFYPPRLLAVWLAGESWSLESYQQEVAFHYLLASLLMYLFLLGLVKRPSAALVGSLIYTYSGYLTGYPMLQVSVLESVIWLPLVMLGVHLSVHRPGWSIWGMCIAGVGLALSLLGGHPQTTMQIGYASTAYLLYTGWQRGLDWRSLLGRLGLYGVIAGGLSAIQLLPALELMRLSSRVATLGYADKANGFTGAELLQILWPTLFGTWSPLYIGVVGLLLLVGAALRPSRYRGFWFGVIVVGLFLSMGGNNVIYDAFYLIVPGFSTFRQQERIVSVITFGLIALVTQHFDALLDLERRHEAVATPYRRLVVGIAALLVSVYMVGTVVDLLGGEVTADTLSVFGLAAIVAALFVVWLHRIAGTPDLHWGWAIPLVFLIVVDLFTVGTRSENFLPDVPENRASLPPSLEPYSNIAPQDIRWRVDGAAGVQGDGVLFGIPDIYGTGPFVLASIDELRQIPVRRFWEVLSVRYVTLLEEPPETGQIELLAYDLNNSGEEFQVFQLADPRPLAHLVYDSIDAQGSHEFAREFMADPRVNLRETAILLGPTPLDLPGARPEHSRVDDFQIITPEYWQMRVSTAADALLTVSMALYPGWQATVDGQRVEIVDVYAGLIGVPIRAGEDQLVQLKFKPDSVRDGAIITAVTGIVTLLLALFAPVLERRFGLIWGASGGQQSHNWPGP